MQSFYFKALLTGQPQDADTIKVYAAGTTDLLTGLTNIDGTPLTNPFLVSDAGGVGEWGFLAPNQQAYDVFWDAQGGIYVALTQENIDGEFFQFQTGLPDASRVEGKLFYSNTVKGLTIYNDITGFTWNLGREIPMRCINNTASTLVNGRAAAIIGADLAKKLPEAGYGTAGDSSAINIVGHFTHDIAPGDEGEITVIGWVNDIPSDHLTAGLRTYCSDTIPATGLLTSTPPASPSYIVEMGGCLISDPTEGIVWSQVDNRGNTSDVLKIFNGAILEDHHIEVASDGADITLTLTNSGATFLSLFYDAKFFKFTIPASVILTPGTDSAAALNYVFIPSSTKQLTTNLTGFPTDEQFTPIAEVECFSVLRTQTDGGPRTVQAWTDHLSNAVGQGHLSDINAWIRNTQPASWQNGVLPTFTGSGTGAVEFSTTAGEVYQVHPHQIPVFASPAPFLVNNDTVIAPSTPLTNIANLVLDSTGATLANRSFPLVLWGIANESPAPDKFIINLPSGSYSGGSPDLADADLSGYANYGIPRTNLNNGYLIHRLVGSFNALGTILTIHPYDRDDIRGQTAATAAGGSGAVSSLPATSITVTPGGDITSTDAQSAIEELDEQKRNALVEEITGTHTIVDGDAGKVTLIDGDLTYPAPGVLGQLRWFAYFNKTETDIDTLTDGLARVNVKGFTLGAQSGLTVIVHQHFVADQELSSGDTVVGQVYEISAQSLLDFTTIGAADNNIGTVFTSTGALTLTAADKLIPAYDYVAFGGVS